MTSWAAAADAAFLPEEVHSHKPLTGFHRAESRRMGFPFFLTMTLVLSQPAQQGPPSNGTEETEHQQAARPLNADDLPISLDRIQRALSRPTTIRLSGARQVFRVEVFGQKPTIEDILGPDYLKGPVPYAGMTHQEFLDMVTPKDVQGYAAFSNRAGIGVAATSIALQWALQKAIDTFKEAKDARAREAARNEVQEALDALMRARRAAGLPEK
jgi:hypothetical protein